jgi:murein L,D-transpeptidase YcbB/YkuD
LLAAVRSRLADWPAGAGKDEAADLAALKAAYAESDARVVWTTPSGFTDRARSAIATLERADEHGLDAAAFAVPAEPAGGAAADALAQTEIRLALAVLKYARHARGGRIDPPALSRMIDMRPRLYEPRSLLDAVAVAPDAGAYLDGLNPRHDGYRALKAALAEMRAKAGKDEEAASSPPLPRRKAGDGEMRIVANMERWRWLPDDLGAFHVWDNVPEQVTRVFHDGKVVLKERIVVGKPSTPTPMFSAPMRFVIFQPSWGVPEGIKTNELAPMLRRAQANASGWFFSQNDGASRALRRHELRVFHGGREVNPDSINWASVDVRQFQFTQPPSAKNVLGVVKFRFPNRFDVYMHDTSERHLFSRSQRTFSHGCMRVENPLRFAETILAYDKGWGRERIAALAARSDTTDVTLDKSVPVHIVYFTAVAEPDGKLHTHPDVYGMDSRVASALAGRSVSLASARDEVEKPAPVQRPARREQKPQRGSAERSPPPRPFNPFSGLTGN